MVQSEQRRRPGWLKPVLVLLAVAGVVFLLRTTGLTQVFSAEHIGTLKDFIAGLGWRGPIAYIFIYVAACLFFLPGLAVTLVAGVFGAVMGTVYVSIGSTLGAAAAFLVARHALRPTVEGWAATNPTFRKIDDGVETQGWRMVMITRLVPLFPFNLQNYAYGLTKIRFWTYILVSWICMLPGTIAFVFAGGSIISGEGNLKKTLSYLAVAAVFFVLLSLIPPMIKKGYQVEPAADGGNLILNGARNADST